MLRVQLVCCPSIYLGSFSALMTTDSIISFVPLFGALDGITSSLKVQGESSLFLPPSVMIRSVPLALTANEIKSFVPLSSSTSSLFGRYILMKAKNDQAFLNDLTTLLTYAVPFSLVQ